MFNLSDTICAICTPPGTGSIAAIRLSGPGSWEIAKKIFETAKRRNGELANILNANSPRRPVAPSLVRHFEHMHALHGYIKDGEKIIDEVIILPYKSPNSFTTEDIIEIFCHGGNQIASMILDLCLANGARRASGGEFTFRAFINGRIDLTEAEAINEVIHAQTDKSVYGVSEILLGSLKEKVINFREKIFNLITQVEGSIEFPMDVPNINKKEVTIELNNINKELNKLIESSREGQILREGIKVSIIGAPNVGKSSLLNQLLGNQRAIVTSEPGTTRDTVEEKLIIDGYPIILIDTAGIREKKQLKETEKLGIERSQIALKNSDIALLIFDLTCGKNKDTNEIFNLINGKPNIVIGNKVDLVGDQAQNQCDVLISAKYGTNLDELKKLIIKKIKFHTKFSVPSPQSFYINQRQKELLLQCSSHIKFAIEALSKNEPEDLIADEFKKAVSKLDEVTGKIINDEVIQNIFSRFCIGK